MKTSYFGCKCYKVISNVSQHELNLENTINNHLVICHKDVKLIYNPTTNAPSEASCAPHPLSAGGLSLQPNFQKGGLDRILRGGGRGLLEKRGWLFSGRVAVKNKLKSEIFNNKKSLSTKVFFCHNLEFKLGNFIQDSAASRHFLAILFLWDWIV